MSSDLFDTELIYTFFDTEVMYLYFFFYKALTTFSEKRQNFPHYVLNAFLHSYLLTMKSLIYCKIKFFYPPIFCFGLQLDSSNIYSKALVIIIPFLLFKGITHASLLKISITHNEKQIPLLNLLTNCLLARSAPQILSIKDEYTFHFSNFLIIGLYNYSTNFWIDKF